jgi:hypothetical protein
MKRYNHSFDRIVINNRWKRKWYSRSDNYCYLGIGKRYFSPTDYEYYISFFGIDIRVFIKKIVINNLKEK